MNLPLFFNAVRAKLFGGHLYQTQVDGINAIINIFAQNNDLRFTAYALATAYHETGKAMAGVREYDRGANRPYAKKIKHSGVPYDTPNVIFYGRGLVQLSWYENYQMMGRLLGVDLLNNPDLALNLDVAVKIMHEGMTKGASSFGDFTGKCLEMYFNSTVNDPINARKIINGTDKATLIEGYYQVFYAALLLK